MADSLRDQLLKSGLATKFKLDQPAVQRPANRPKPDARPRPPHPASSGEPDLAQAYAARARTERAEKEREQREAEQRGREKRERKEKLNQLLAGKALNVADAELARHFPHAGKIRRVYCTAEQLLALNRGDIAVVQQNGRFLLVDKAVANEVAATNPDALLLLVDPNATPDDDVPADLIW